MTHIISPSLTELCYMNIVANPYAMRPGAARYPQPVVPMGGVRCIRADFFANEHATYLVQ